MGKKKKRGLAGLRGGRTSSTATREPIPAPSVTNAEQAERPFCIQGVRRVGRALRQRPQEARRMTFKLFSSQPHQKIKRTHPRGFLRGFRAIPYQHPVHSFFPTSLNPNFPRRPPIDGVAAGLANRRARDTGLKTLM